MVKCLQLVNYKTNKTMTTFIITIAASISFIMVVNQIMKTRINVKPVLVKIKR